MARSVLDFAFDELADDDVEPFGGWGEGVKVTTIRPSFNLHDPMVVEPGLIRISLDYGWMRAADVIDLTGSDSQYAQQLSDELTLLRARNWWLAHAAAGADYQDPHRGFTDFVLSGVTPPASSEIRWTPDPDAVVATRANCLRIRSLLEQRLRIGAPTPPKAARTSWFTEWELTTDRPRIASPWARFISAAGELPAEPAPAPI
jgi:hypothetical protein